MYALSWKGCRVHVWRVLVCPIVRRPQPQRWSGPILGLYVSGGPLLWRAPEFSRNRQIHNTILKGAQTMKCKLWTETLEFSRLKVPNSRSCTSRLGPFHGFVRLFSPLIPRFYRPFSGCSWHLSRQLPVLLSSRFALHGLRAFEIRHETSSGLLNLHTALHDNVLQFPNAVVLNAVGRRNMQMSAKQHKWAQKSANASPQKSARVQKSAKRVSPETPHLGGLKRGVPESVPDSFPESARTSFFFGLVCRTTPESRSKIKFFDTKTLLLIYFWPTFRFSRNPTFVLLSSTLIFSGSWGGSSRPTTSHPLQFSGPKSYHMYLFCGFSSCRLSRLCGLLQATFYLKSCRLQSHFRSKCWVPPQS